MSTASQLTKPERRRLDTELLLQMNVGLLVILGTSLLAMGQQNILYALVAATAAGTAIIVTDIKGYFRLGPDATTLAALFACVVLVVQVIHNVEQSQLLNVANVLVYLQVILLFQEKQDRVYWSLMALSLLQVIVAAALNLGLMFGLLLGVYVLAAGTALMLFYVVREIRPYIHDSSSDRRLGLDDGPGGRATFFGTLNATASTQIINHSLLKRLGRMIVFTALATTVVFFAIPRYGRSVWQGDTHDTLTTVGFTEEVRLNDIGRILESSEQVMRVELTDLQGRSYQVDGDPYFRGTVLTKYRKGVWTQQKFGSTVRPLVTQSSFDLASTILQRITLQPGSHSVLFSVSPCYFVDGTPIDLNVDLFTRQLSLNDDNDDQLQSSFRYVLGTTAFRNGWQRDLVPAFRNTEEIVNWDTSDESVQDALRQNQPSLVAVADAIIADTGLQQASMFDRAKALENHFHRSGIYTYSLDVNQNRNEQLDPIEDFVRNHHTGHCEYFASALTLMLRSQEIPARMVVGYRGGEFNAVGSYFIVQQLHAHAWVEAFLSEDEIPDDDRDFSESLANGCWLRLDPTPFEVDAAEDLERLAIITTIREFVAYSQVLWDDYVLGLNSERQQQAIYRPIRRSLRMIRNSLFGARAWQARGHELNRFAARIVRTFGVPSLVVVVLVIVLIVGLGFRSRRWIWHNVGQIVAQMAPARASSIYARPRLEVYRRMESALARIGLERASSQTLVEFAGTAEHQLAQRVECRAAIEVPRRVAEAYYRFRFGNQRLTAAETRRLLADVKTLEKAIL